MGETDKTKQGVPQNTGQSSEGEKGNTSENIQTYTKESTAKAVSDALATAGRTAKALSDREAAVQAREDTQAQAQAKRDEAELAAVQGDPDQLTAVQKKQRLQAQEADFKKREEVLARSMLEHEDALNAVKKSEREQTAARIAQEHNVDASVLVKFGGDSAETMEELAKTLPEKKASTSLKPDSSANLGPGKDLSGKSPMQLATEAYGNK